MDRYKFRLTGETPLLMHADDVALSDTLMAWRKDPANKNLSVKGDDRSPAWTWKTYCYSDGVRLVLPSDNLMTALREAGAMVILKKNTTFKSITQSGIIVDQFHMPLLVKGKEVSHDVIEGIDGTYDQQCEQVRQYGFELFAKRATVGSAKHVRVRPRFDAWAVEGTLTVTATKEITEDVLVQIMEIAGQYKGLGDWRPSAPKKPGQFGRFSVKLQEID